MTFFEIKVVFHLRFINFAFLLACAVSLSVFAAVPNEDNAKIENKKEASSDSALSSRLLFQVIASEIALQRQEAGAAYRTYMSVAEETKDPRMAQRALEIAQLAKAPKEMRIASEEWLKLDPDNLSAQITYIESCIALGEYGRVEAITKNYLKSLKDPEGAIQKLTSQLLLSKDKKQALLFYTQTTSQFSDLPTRQLGLARLEAMNGRLTSAEKLARSVYLSRPTAESAVTLASLLLKEKPKEALRILGEYLSVQPTDTKVRNLYASLLAQTGDFEKLLELANSYKDDPEFSISLATSLMQAGKNSQALQVLERFISRNHEVIKQEGNLSKAYLLLSYIENDLGHSARALEYTFLVKGALQSTAMLQRANIYVKLNQTSQALNTLDSITTKDPQLITTIALYKAKLIAEGKGDHAALKVLETAIKKVPDSRALHYEAAMIAERMDNLKAAENHLKTAIKIDPNFSNAYNSLGYTLLERTKRLKEAAANINKAYQLDPENPYILDSKGWLAFKQKKYQEAINYLTEAQKRAQEPDIYLHLIEAYWQSGQKIEAKVIFEKAKELWPNSVEIDAIGKKLGIKNAK